MKYLKLMNEAAVRKTPEEIKSEFSKLWQELCQKTDVLTLDTNIDHLFIDIKDEFIDMNVRNYSSDLILKYKKTNLRESKLSINFYKSVLSGSAFSSENTRYLGRFLELCKFAKNLKFQKVMEFYVEFNTKKPDYSDEIEKYKGLVQ
jgi:hypothetical protein